MPDADISFDVTPVAAPPTKRRGRWRSIGVLVVLALAVLALLSQGLLHSLNYFETVDQAMSSRAKLGTQTFRLEGVVVAQTIDRTSTRRVLLDHGGTWRGGLRERPRHTASVIPGQHSRRGRGPLHQ